MLKYILISFLIITNAYAYTCEEMGYTKSIADCPEGGLKCPAQPEKMFCCDRCGSAGGYKYNEDNCSPDDGLQLAGTECGGGWTECRQCTSEYKYNKDNCRSPKVLAGIQCGNAYTQCVYPTGIGCVPTVGYIYYSDGSCHAEYDGTKEAIGVIIDASKKIMIALDEEKYPWNDGSENRKDVADLPNLSKEQALLDMDGEGNTDKIVAFALSSGQEHKAAGYCANKTDGNRKWYLPALGELYILYNNALEIQTSLANIGTAKQLTMNDYYSVSSERTYVYIWPLKLDNGAISLDGGKVYVLPTRCFAHF